MRLVDGVTQYEGTVQIRWNSEWRTICSDGWDDQDAVVVCRQFNYLATSVHIQGSYNNYYSIKQNTCNTIIIGLIKIGKRY